MKQTLLLSALILNFLCYSQGTESIQLKKTYLEKDYLPQIKGVFDGEINILDLASEEGIKTNVPWKVYTFTISYPSGRDFISRTISSFKIPEDIIKEIVRSCLKEQIYITKIMAYDELNVSHQLKSMVLIPLPNDE